MKKHVTMESAVANIIRGLLILSAAFSLHTKNYLNFFTAVMTLWLTFLPFIIARKNHIKLPQSFQIVILLFIFGAQYLGELKDYYFRFWWWDKMLHTFSGIILGFIGYLLIYVLNNEKKVDVYLSPFFMVFFSFTFAVCVGALWEIFEFTMDNTFGLNMQKSGLVDTMWDLIVDCIGAFISAFCGYQYETRKENGWFKRMFNAFMKMNRKLFKKKNNHGNRKNHNKGFNIDSENDKKNISM